MSRSGLTVLLMGLLICAGASRSEAQRHEIPQLNSCIKEFYDPEMYNWLTFKNTCLQSLTIVFVAKDGVGAGGTMDLRAGGKDSVGRSKGKAAKVGSFELFVCPGGYVPTDDSNQVVNKLGSNFRCEQKQKQ